MGLYNVVFGKEKDPELQAIEQKAFLEEKAKVEQEKKELSLKKAEVRGKAKARGIPEASSIDYKKTTENISKTLGKVVDWMSTRQGATDFQNNKTTNPFETDFIAPWETPQKSKKKSKTKKQKKTKTKSKTYKQSSGKDIHIHLG